MVMRKEGAVRCRMGPTTCVGSKVVGDSWCTVTTHLLILSAREGTTQGTGGAQLAGDKPVPIAGPLQHIPSPWMCSPTSRGLSIPLFPWSLGISGTQCRDPGCWGWQEAIGVCH